MNLLEMLTQKRTDPLSSFVAREKMIRRNPMKFVGDTATRLGGGDPDASVLDLVVDHETTPRTSDITADAPDTAKKGNAKLKGAITDIGGMLASALTPEQKTPLQFAPMQRQEFMPIIDPRFRRAKGGPIKKGQPYLVGEEGAEVIVPETATRLGGGDPDDLDRRFDELDLVVDHETTPRTPGLIVESPDTGKKGNGKLKGAITDIGGMLASALSPEQKTPLQFAPMQRQEFMPIIDPRFRRAKGGPIKKGQPYLVGEEGAEVIVPEHDGMVIPNEQIAVDEDLGTQVPLDAPDEKIAINETPTTATVTEQVKQPTIADKLGAQINAYQDPDRYKKGSEFYDKKRNWKDALRSAGYGLLQSLASAPPTNDVGALLGRAIGGAGTGAVMGATMDNVDEKMRDQFKLAQLIPQYQNAYGMERQKKADDMAEVYKKAQIRNLDEDNANAKWGRQIQERNLEQRERNRVSSETTARMNAVAGMLKNVPEFIPGDPKFKELEQALGDVKLPIFQKDAKKNVELKQDNRTGAWTVILTNPVTKEVESRPVPGPNGQQLTTTPLVVMQGEYGKSKQDDQQQFTASENEKNRQQRKSEFIANYNAKLADDARLMANDTIKRQQWVMSQIKQIRQDLAKGRLDDDTANAMLESIGKFK